METIDTHLQFAIPDAIAGLLVTLLRAVETDKITRTALGIPANSIILAAPRNKNV